MRNYKQELTRALNIIKSVNKQLDELNAKHLLATSSMIGVAA